MDDSGFVTGVKDMLSGFMSTSLLESEEQDVGQVICTAR